MVLDISGDEQKLQESGENGVREVRQDVEDRCKEPGLNSDAMRCQLEVFSREMA